MVSLIVNGTGVSFKKKAFILVHLLTEAHHQQKNPKEMVLGLLASPYQVSCLWERNPPFRQVQEAQNSSAGICFPSYSLVTP